MNVPAVALASGIHEMHMAEYIALPAFSASLAYRLLVESPLHAWTDSAFNPAREPDNSKVSDLGSYAHACLLEGGCDRLRVVIADDWRTKAARESRDEAYACGEIPILHRQVGEVAQMIGVAMEFIASSELAGIFETGAPEQTLIWDDVGVLCRARPDWLDPDTGVNLHYKTTMRSARPESFIRSTLTAMGYDLAAVFYERGVETALPKAGKSTSVLLIQEQTAPYACSLIGLSNAMSELATRKLDRALEVWRQCVRLNHWPAYSPQIHYAELLPWQQAELEREIHGDHFTDEELKDGIPV